MTWSKSGNWGSHNPLSLLFIMRTFHQQVYILIPIILIMIKTYRRRLKWKEYI